MGGLEPSAWVSSVLVAQCQEVAVRSVGEEDGWMECISTKESLCAGLSTWAITEKAGITSKGQAPVFVKPKKDFPSSLAVLLGHPGAQ